MSMRNKLLMLVGIALSGLVLLSSLSLYELRQNLLADRMEKTRNLVEMAVSVTGYYEREAQEGRLETADAQRLAKNALTRLRYDGDEYFFVLDQELTYVAHGFKQALVGKSAFGVSTPDGEDVGQLLRGALQGNGEFHYRWDKPGSSAPVQKLSFVASSPAWHWVIGTGIYVDDVDSAFWRAAMFQLSVIGVLIAILLVVSIVIVRDLLRRLGGEPAYAVTVVRQIAAGHLTTPVRLRANDHDSLLASIADMQAQLRELIGNIVQTADDLGRRAGEIEAHAGETADHSEQQSQAAAAMASAIEQLTGSIRQIADHAGDARARSQASGEISRQSSEVIGRTIDEIRAISSEVGTASSSISELADKTESIRSIMGVIRDVADQTNLLALNAAIEAARAGESGRGFAVVADEVRKLAERTTSATHEIATMISAIQATSDASCANIGDAVRRAGQGVALAAEGGEAIARVQESAAQVVQVVNDISHSLNEQSQASNEIASHVEQIAQGAATNAAIVRDTARATVELHALTQRLRESVVRFNM